MRKIRREQGEKADRVPLFKERTRNKTNLPSPQLPNNNEKKLIREE